jgi:hypothetical protein
MKFCPNKECENLLVNDIFKKYCSYCGAELLEYFDNAKKYYDKKEGLI